MATGSHFKTLLVRCLYNKQSNTWLLGNMKRTGHCGKWFPGLSVGAKFYRWSKTLFTLSSLASFEEYSPSSSRSLFLLVPITCSFYCYHPTGSKQHCLSRGRRSPLLFFHSLVLRGFSLWLWGTASLTNFLGDSVVRMRAIMATPRCWCNPQPRSQSLCGTGAGGSWIIQNRNQKTLVPVE